MQRLSVDYDIKSIKDNMLSRVIYEKDSIINDLSQSNARLKKRVQYLENKIRDLELKGEIDKQLYQQIIDTSRMDRFINGETESIKRQLDTEYIKRDTDKVKETILEKKVMEEINSLKKEFTDMIKGLNRNNNAPNIIYAGSTAPMTAMAPMTPMTSMTSMMGYHPHMNGLPSYHVPQMNHQMSQQMNHQMNSHAQQYPSNNTNNANNSNTSQNRSTKVKKSKDYDN